MAENLAVFFGIQFGAWFLASFLSWLMHRAMNKVQLPQLLEQFLVKAVRWVVMITGGIVALTALEISVALLLAMVGAASCILAFALKDSLGNFASGLMILFFLPFDIGDLVEVGGVTGKVLSLNLVATTIRTADNREIIVPNNTVFSNIIPIPPVSIHGVSIWNSVSAMMTTSIRFFQSSHHEQLSHGAEKSGAKD